jgi:uncharacterized surface protein with fasciclin (FAS1) repeats
MSLRNQTLVLVDPEATAPLGEDRDLLGALQWDGRFRSFLHLLRRAEIATDLCNGGPFTVLAPTDAAFAVLDLEEIDLLLSTPELLMDVAEHHLIEGRWTEAALSARGTIPTLQGEVLAVRSRAGLPTIGDAAIEPAMRCRNGIVHVVDRVLVPHYGLRAGATVGRRLRKFHRDLQRLPIALAGFGRPCDPRSPPEAS